MTSLFGQTEQVAGNVKGTFVSERVVATGGQTVITLTKSQYVKGTGSLVVFKNGSRVSNGVEYTETSTSSFTFATGLASGDVIVFDTYPQIDLSYDNTNAIANTTLATQGAGMVGFNDSLVYPPGSTGAAIQAVEASLLTVKGGGVESLTKNLVVTAAGNNSKILVQFEQAVVKDSANTYYQINNFSGQVDLSASGIGGIDSGVVANLSWYSIWLLYNPTSGTAGLVATKCALNVSCSITAGSKVITGLATTANFTVGMVVYSASFVGGYNIITSIDSASQITCKNNAATTNAAAILHGMITPIGQAAYTHKALLSMTLTWTPVSTKLPRPYVQKGAEVTFRYNGGLNGLPSLAAGVLGDPTVPTYYTFTVMGGALPPNAIGATFQFAANTTASISMMLSDYTATEAIGGTTNMPRYSLKSASGFIGSQQFKMETSFDFDKLYYCTDGASAKLWVSGFTLPI